MSYQELGCCTIENTKVIDSRQGSDSRSIRRRRECITCSRRFTTYERVEDYELVVLKRDGTIIDDFKIVKNKNNIHVLSAPSPAATACLAIGDEIIEQARSHFNI